MTDFARTHAGISDLFSRYAEAVWRKDHLCFADCFTEDAEWRIGGGIRRGRKEIGDQIKFVLDRYTRVLVTLRPPILQIGNGTAQGRALLSEECIFKDGKVIVAIGTYFDHYVEQGDRWRFKWRLFQTQYAGPKDFSGPFFENPDFGPPPAMPPLDTPSIDHTGIHKHKAD